MYIDDILIIQQEGKSTPNNLVQVEQILERLKYTVFKANLWKSFFMQNKIEYTGYRLISDGLGP